MIISRLAFQWNVLILLSSLPSFESKAYKKIYDIKIRNQIANKDISDNYRFGFRANHSTVHPVALLGIGNVK